MLRAVLVDDEKPALNMLAKLIAERGDVQVVAAYTDPEEMLKDVTKLRPDVAFLDIEMPEMNGLELAERLLELPENIEVVFITAYREYALEAFRVNALDYILKPVDPDMLHQACRRALKRIKASAPVKETGAASRIVCFGGLEIYTADEQAAPIRFPTAKAEELFAYLLVHRNANISKWTLCDSLWPEYKTERSEHNLHTTVYRMKKTLRDYGIRVHVHSQRGFYRLECEEACDYVQFEEEIDGMIEVSDGNIDALMKVYRLYRGSLFADRDYAWCEAERERMSRYFAGLAKKLAVWHSENGHDGQAIDVLLTMLNCIPFDGEAHELLLRTFIRVKDSAAFFAHYEKVETIFKEELGLELPAQLRRLYADMN